MITLLNLHRETGRNLSLTAMCRVLAVNRADYYRAHRPPLVRDETALPDAVQRIAREKSCPMQDDSERGVFPTEDDPETTTAGRGHTADECESPGSILNVSRWSKWANLWPPAAASALPAPTAKRSMMDRCRLPKGFAGSSVNRSAVQPAQSTSVSGWTSPLAPTGGGDVQGFSAKRGGIRGSAGIYSSRARAKMGILA